MFKWAFIWDFTVCTSVNLIKSAGLFKLRDPRFFSKFFFKFKTDITEKKKNKAIKTTYYKCASKTCIITGTVKITQKDD